MFFPIGTDRDGRHPAIATLLIIVLNIVAYAAMHLEVGARMAVPGSGETPVDAFVSRLWLWRADFHWWQLITYQFVHDPSGFGHIGMNMLALWVFGKPVESHVGFWRFLVLYLLLGAFAGIVQCLLVPAPCIGASGSVMGTLGLFVALFPRSQTMFFYLFIGVGTFSMPSAWVAGIYVLIDILRQALEWGGSVRNDVGSIAHLAGIAGGIALGIGLLRFGVVPRGDWDLLYALAQRARRRRHRAALREAEVSPWRTHAIGDSVRGDGMDGDPVSTRVAELRAAVQGRLRANEVSSALNGYRELVAIAPAATLPVQAQIDVANHAMASGQASLAAHAYRAFLAAYQSDSRADEVRLLLAAILVRRLHQPDEAQPLLAEAARRVTDASQRSLVDALLAESERATAGTRRAPLGSERGT